MLNQLMSYELQSIIFAKERELVFLNLATYYYN